MRIKNIKCYNFLTKNEAIKMNYKKDFPIFNNNKNLVYLDSASTSLTPKLVIDEMTKYYTHYGSNIGESESKITINTTKKFNENREALANFINANNNEIVFTYNSTAAANFIVYGLKNTFNKGDEIILTHLEHSSNLLPWIRMIELKGIKIIYAPLKDGIIDISKLENIISHKTKVMSFNHISNSVGGLNDAKNISSILKKHNIISILDASQSAGHILIDVKKLDIDFMFFAPHKMFASTGIGILYGKRKMLDKLNPIIIGGGSASEIDIDDNSFSYNQVPYKLEAGTPNISGVFSLKPAIDYVNSIGIKNMWKHIIDLKKYSIKK